MIAQSQLHRAERNYYRQEPKWGKTMDESQVEKLADEMMKPGALYDPFEAQNFLDAMDHCAFNDPHQFSKFMDALKNGICADAYIFQRSMTENYNRRNALDAARHQLENEE